MLTEKQSLALLQKVEVESLYQNLIQQLNKDFQLSNLNEHFNLSITPVQLKEALSRILVRLITNHYDDYLNFLYRVDVSEKELLTIKGVELLEIVEQITFIILKREYQKVWFKNKF
ncbi:MAG: hypothetical protein QM495_05650 [Lutibacter sp.]|uniref:hypothetical protein n=1 Tax=Lutibacter sp. TaxID=1925666 RepID=UPI0038587283